MSEPVDIAPPIEMRREALFIVAEDRSDQHVELNFTARIERVLLFEAREPGDEAAELRREQLIARMRERGILERIPRLVEQALRMEFGEPSPMARPEVCQRINGQVFDSKGNRLVVTSGDAIQITYTISIE